MSLKSLVVAGCSLMLSGEAAAQKTPPKSISQMERTWPMDDEIAFRQARAEPQQEQLSQPTTRAS
jgi:hypothetical protein